MLTAERATCFTHVTGDMCTEWAGLARYAVTVSEDCMFNDMYV